MSKKTTTTQEHKKHPHSFNLNVAQRALLKGYLKRLVTQQISTINLNRHSKP